MQDTPRTHAGVIASYVLCAIVFTWPLVLHLGSHLTGPPTGDTGVYVWNQWVFQHELLEQRRLPYFTDRIFSLSPRIANLSLHNYTTFQNLLALPLMGAFGVVATFNLVYLAMSVLTAYCAFLLAKRVTGAVAESWIAGVIFAWCPVLLTRGMGHFSVAAAAPLAVFMIVLLRTAERERLRDAVLLGVTVAWAAFTDVYFAIYCLLMAIVYLGGRAITIEAKPRPHMARRAPWALDVVLLGLAGLAVAMAVSGGWQVAFLGRVARMRSLYTPMLALTVLLVVRLAWPYRATLARVGAAERWRFVRLTATTGFFAVLVVSPVLYAFSVRLAQVGFDPGAVYWRSSPAGVDLLSYLLPNPNHPLVPEAVRAWLTPRPDAYLENVASIPWLALGVVAMAWRSGWRPPRLWVTFTAVFGLLALGPFIQVAGLNTHMPGPWAFLRYVPVVGLARTPTRFATVVMLAVAMLVASALVWLGRRWPERRRLLLVSATLLLVVELVPARQLYSAAIPRIYQYVLSAPQDGRVLELPFGVRDGTSSVGNFTARSQYFQTYHGRMLIGGYLSRVSRQRVDDIRRIDMLDGLVRLSEGQVLTADQRGRLVADGRAFVRRSRISFVVVDRDRASADLRAFARSAFGLVPVATDGNFELYRPADGF